MPNKIKISYELFKNTISLLKELDIDDYPPEIVQLYGYVLNAFNNKKTTFELRSAYTNLISCDEGLSHLESFKNYNHHPYDNVPF